MAGRGKELTLPAWMTSGSGVPAVTSESQAISAPPSGQPGTTSVSASFAASSAQQPPPPTSVPPASSVGLPGPMAPSFPPPMTAGMPPMMPPFAPPHFPPMAGFPPPYGMPPGAGFPMMSGFFPGMMPGMMPPPRFIPPPIKPPAGATGTALGGPVERTTDPNNDITCWTEHKTEDNRRYWYNSVTLASTYEKPLCLKTPEERSIPPCPWKEYTSPEGKVYYSDGNESSWTMPEEYRIWKEKIDTIEKRLAEKKEAAKHDFSSSKQHQHKNQSSKQTKQSSVETSQIPAFASVTEAMEAFKEMLGRYEISATAKLKEVTDICSEDPMWNAITSNGERKQALAEYQTKRLKLEKDEMKNRQRKRRDAFLHMLAENTEIDARTRWRTAQDILKDDIRYKNIEDTREREDLYSEFISELEKKEREDRLKNHQKAVGIFREILQEMKNDGVVHSRSIWSEHKDNLMTLLTQRPDLKLLDESDIRRLFIDLTAQLQQEAKLQERKQKEEFARLLETRVLEVKQYLESLVLTGVITAQTRWKELLSISQVMENSTLLTLKSMFAKSETATKSETAEETEFLRILHQTFDRVISVVQESYREDKKLIKRFLSTVEYRVEVNTTYDELYTRVLAFANLREKSSAETADGTVRQLLEVIPEQPQQQQHAQPNGSNEEMALEEGEEPDETPPALPETTSTAVNAMQVQVQQMMLTRPATLKAIFTELQQKAVEEYEEEQRYKRKAEDKFLSLLREYFYLSDHINITWDEAKPILQQRSSYDVVGKHQRRRLFALHMKELREKMEQRTLSMKASGISASSASHHMAMEVNDGREAAGSLAGKKRERSESLSRHYHGGDGERRYDSKDRGGHRGGSRDGHGHRSSLSRERSAPRTAATSYDRDGRNGRDGRGRSAGKLTPI